MQFDYEASIQNKHFLIFVKVQCNLSYNFRSKYDKKTNIHLLGVRKHFLSMTFLEIVFIFVQKIQYLVLCEILFIRYHNFRIFSYLVRLFCIQADTCSQKSQLFFLLCIKLRFIIELFYNRIKMISNANLIKSSNLQSRSCVNLLQLASERKPKVSSPSPSKINEYNQQWSNVKKQKSFEKINALVHHISNPQQKIKFMNFEYVNKTKPLQSTERYLYNKNLVRFSNRENAIDSPNETYKKKSKVLVSPDSPVKSCQPANRNNLTEQKQLKGTASTQSNENHIGLSRVPSFIKLKKQPSNSSKKQKNNTFSIKNFVILRKIGETKHSKVFLVIEKCTNFLLVMKVFEKDQILSQNTLEQFVRQVKIQTYINHPNIIKLYGVFQDQGKLHLLMEYGCDGNLYQLQQRKKFSEEAVSYITNQLLSACNYIHNQKIIHRDLKPENIVLIHGTAKLCDFGTAVFKGIQLRSTYCGTPLYFSPELMKGEAYGEKIDVWAIGVMAFQLFTGESPFNIRCRRDLIKIITDSIKMVPNMSEQFGKFLSLSLKKNPIDRPNCQQLLTLPFFSQYEKLETCEQLFK